MTLVSVSADIAKSKLLQWYCMLLYQVLNWKNFINMQKVDRHLWEIGKESQKVWDEVEMTTMIVIGRSLMTPGNWQFMALDLLSNNYRWLYKFMQTKDVLENFKLRLCHFRVANRDVHNKLEKHR